MTRSNVDEPCPGGHRWKRPDDFIVANSDPPQIKYECAECGETKLEPVDGDSPDGWVETTLSEAEARAGRLADMGESEFRR